LILSDSYYLTSLDYYLIVNKFQMPTFFISGKYIFETGFVEKEFLAYGNREEAFCFIIIPGIKAEEIPGFKVIQSSENKSFFKISEIKNNQTLINAINNKVDVKNYIEMFSKVSVATALKKKPQLAIVEEDVEEEPVEVDVAQIQEAVVPVPTIKEPVQKKRRTAKDKKVVDKRKTKKTIGPILQISSSS